MRTVILWNDSWVQPSQCHRLWSSAWKGNIEIVIVTRDYLIWTCIWSNRFCGTSKFTIGGTTCFMTFALWQCWHSRAQRETSWRRVSQTNFSKIVCCVLSTPMWPRPWRASKTFLRQEKGTKGRLKRLQWVFGVQCRQHGDVGYGV